MGDTIHWITQNYTVSLFPFLFSALLTYFAYEGLTWKMIDPGLLSFSMAVLTIGLMTQFSIDHKNDPMLCKTISTYYSLFIITFLGIFSWVIALKVQNESFVTQIISSISETAIGTQINNFDSVHTLISMNMKTLSQLDFVRPAPLFVALALFSYSIFIKMKYSERMC